MPRREKVPIRIKFIHEQRKNLGWTIRDLVGKAFDDARKPVDAKTIRTALETGVATMRTVQAIKNALKLSPEDILEVESDPPADTGLSAANAPTTPTTIVPSPFGEVITHQEFTQLVTITAKVMGALESAHPIWFERALVGIRAGVDAVLAHKPETYHLKHVGTRPDNSFYLDLEADGNARKGLIAAFFDGRLQPLGIYELRFEAFHSFTEVVLLFHDRVYWRTGTDHPTQSNQQLPEAGVLWELVTDSAMFNVAFLLHNQIKITSTLTADDVRSAEKMFEAPPTGFSGGIDVSNFPGVNLGLTFDGANVIDRGNTITGLSGTGQVQSPKPLPTQVTSSSDSSNARLQAGDDRETDERPQNRTVEDVSKMLSELKKAENMKGSLKDMGDTPDDLISQ